MESCDFGILKDDVCHRETFTRTKKLVDVSEVSESTLETFLWRSGLRDHVVKTICSHHDYGSGSLE